ncbi:MAG: hypothetical protein RIR99_107 [Actinomycetota bacterium]|jgi:hypothetical protein
MITIKKVGAITALALALSTPGALAVDTAAPLNTLTAREQAVIDFQNSMATYTATVRTLQDKFRTDMAAFQAAQSARQALIRPLADARQAAVAQANAAFTAAIANVTTQEARDAVVKTRKDAIAAAHTTFKAAVDALGAAPVKPAKPTLPTKPTKPTKPAKAEKAPKAGN